MVVAMVSETPIEIAWELHQAKQPVTYIAARVGVIAARVCCSQLRYTVRVIIDINEIM